MNIQLKKEIILFIIVNDKEFQITNCVVNKFRNYIYDDQGNYLIGGKEVTNFIHTSIDLILR